MSYKIRYKVAGKRHYPTGARPPKSAFVVAVIMLLFVVVSLWYGSTLWILPGDPQVTASALEKLIEQLSEGAAFSEAVTVFCREVVAGAR